MSVIKIQTETPSIPIEIGALKFKFDTSDESIQSFYKNANSIQEEMNSLEVEEGKEIETAQKVLRKGYDLMLGEGAFDKIYKQSPSVNLCMKYFFQLSESIGQELDNMGLTESQQTKIEKYLQTKKK